MGFFNSTATGALIAISLGGLLTGTNIAWTWVFGDTLTAAVERKTGLSKTEVV